MRVLVAIAPRSADEAAFNWARPDLGDWPTVIGAIASAAVAIIAVLFSARMARLAIDAQRRTAETSFKNQRSIANDDRLWTDRKQAYLDVIEWLGRVRRQVTFPGPIEGEDEWPKNDLALRLELFGEHEVRRRFKETVSLYDLWRREGRRPPEVFVARTQGDDIEVQTQWAFQLMEILRLKIKVLSLEQAVRAKFADADPDDAGADTHDVISTLEYDDEGTPIGVRTEPWQETLD